VSSHLPCASSNEILFIRGVDVDCPRLLEADVCGQLWRRSRRPSVHNGDVTFPLSHYGSAGVVFQKVKGGKAPLAPAHLSAEKVTGNRSRGRKRAATHHTHGTPRAGDSTLPLRSVPQIPEKTAWFGRPGLGSPCGSPFCRTGTLCTGGTVLHPQ